MRVHEQNRAGFRQADLTARVSPRKPARVCHHVRSDVIVNSLPAALLVLSLNANEIERAKQALVNGVRRFMRDKAAMVAAVSACGLGDRVVTSGTEMPSLLPTPDHQAKLSYLASSAAYPAHLFGASPINGGHIDNSGGVLSSTETSSVDSGVNPLSLDFRTIGAFGTRVLFLSPPLRQRLLLQAFHVELARAFGDQGIPIVGAGSGWNSAMQIQKQVLASNETLALDAVPGSEAAATRISEPAAFEEVRPATASPGMPSRVEETTSPGPLEQPSRRSDLCDDSFVTSTPQHLRPASQPALTGLIGSRPREALVPGEDPPLLDPERRPSEKIDDTDAGGGLSCGFGSASNANASPLAGSTMVASRPAFVPQQHLIPESATALDRALLRQYDLSSARTTLYIPQITLFKISKAAKRPKAKNAPMPSVPK